MALTEPRQEEHSLEMTEWEGGDVSYIHTSAEGEWIEVKDSKLLIDLDEAI